MTKQVIVVRKDLNMRKGKIAAQVSHASLGVFTRRMKKAEDKDVYTCILTPAMQEWLDSSYTKIVVSCDNEQELFALQAAATKNNIPNCIVRDNGQTEFKATCTHCLGNGSREIINLDPLGDTATLTLECELCGGTGKVNVPTYTCIAIGPDTCEKIDELTKGYPLL